MTQVCFAAFKWKTFLSLLQLDALILTVYGLFETLRVQYVVLAHCRPVDRCHALPVGADGSCSLDPAGTNWVPLFGGETTTTGPGKEHFHLNLLPVQ